MAPGMEWNDKVYDYSADDKKLAAKSTCHIRKFFTPEDTDNEYDSPMDYYVIRYAEVLISLAEAMNEKGGYSPSDITKYVNELRARVGMPSVENAEVAKMGKTLDQETLREIIRHERRIELAFEDLRFEDLYRWKDMETGKTEWEVSQERLSGWEVGKVSLYQRNFRGPQDTVWPIPQTDLFLKELQRRNMKGTSSSGPMSSMSRDVRPAAGLMKKALSATTNYSGIRATMPLSMTDAWSLRPEPSHSPIHGMTVFPRTGGAAVKTWNSLQPA